MKLVGASGNFFSGLGVTPAAGRAFQPSDDTSTADPVAVVSHRFWQSNLGGELSAIGRTIQIDGQPVTIVGVAPAEFFGVEPGSAPDLWVPLHWYAAEWAKLNGETSSAKFLSDKRAWWVGVIGRIKPGVTDAAATAEMSVLFQQTLQTTTDHPSGGMIAEYGGAGPAEEHSARKAVTPQLAITPLAHGLDTLRREFSTSLWLLVGMVGLVLLITCSNVASLLITRATSRQKEVAVRLSLGAPKSRIVRQVLTESLLLGIGRRCGRLVRCTLDRYPAFATDFQWTISGLASRSLLTQPCCSLPPRSPYSALCSSESRQLGSLPGFAP